MKKIISLIAVFALMLTMFSGCIKKVPGNTTGDPDEQNPTEDSDTIANDDANDANDIEDDNSNEDDSSDEFDSGFEAGTPADGYSRYVDAKSIATEKIYTKLDENSDSLWAVSLAMLPVTMVDLTLIPISVFSGEDAAAVEMALSFFAYEDIEYSVSGDTYTLVYTDGEGATITQTCEYNSNNDSLTSTISDSNGAETMFFEYVNTGDGYASQYYYPDEENGGYTLLTSYFDSNIVAYGFKAVSSEPGSILGNSNLGADFVDGSDSVYVLEGDKLTIVEEGSESVY